jgi:hypothetical protein
MFLKMKIDDKACKIIDFLKDNETETNNNFKTSCFNDL